MRTETQTMQRNGNRRRLVTIAVPAKDEEDGVRSILGSLPVKELEAMGLDTEVFLLDGHSQDNTCQVARRHGARIIPDPEPGKGAAMRHARDFFNGDFVVMLDADGTYPPGAIPRLLAPLLSGEADVSMGTRVPRRDAMSTVHRVGNVMLSVAASMLYGRPCPDVCTGMWAFHKDVLQSLPLQSTGFELEAELFSLAARLDKRIAHVSIDYRPRIGGDSKLSAFHGLSIAWYLVRSRFTPLPADHTAKPRMAADPQATADELPHPLQAQP